ncbi:MAG TPA: hypothetical protein VLV83_07475, partial [Acidobacteriota bacterium]|nr:hypothetical protein [Acidobacteriota bacterium]
FDRGAHWQPLQLDLPVVPITDIKVYRKDLVVSTMGRSFWILDDISVLHQINDQTASAQAFLFRPRDSYRARWTGSLERRFSGYSPEYPPGGVMVHYHLSHDAQDELKLDVLDSEDRVVRSYSARPRSAGAEEPDQGMRFPRRGRGTASLSTQAGMHRLVWDLEHAPPPNAPRGGATAVPGRYQVRLTLGQWSQTQEFDLLIDPRVADDGVTIDDLRAQFQLVQRLGRSWGRARSAVERIGSVRGQLQSVAENARRAELEEAVSKRADQLARQLTEIEELLVQTEEGKVGAQLEPQLMGQMSYLWSMVTGADQRPAKSAYDRLDDIEEVLQGLQDRLSRLLKDDIAAFNKQLREQKLGPVIFNQP